MRLRIALLSLITLVCMTLAWPLPPGRHRSNPFAAAPQPGGEVHGTIFLAPITSNSSANPVLLPDVDVYLKDIHSLQTSPAGTTDLDGAFILPKQPLSDYQLCWQASGYASGCGSTFTP